MSRLRKIISTFDAETDDNAVVKRFRKLQRRSVRQVIYVGNHHTHPTILAFVVVVIVFRPNGQIIADFVAWCETKTNFTVFGAPWQADTQMIYLVHKYRWIRGVISEDSDIFLMSTYVD